MSKTGGEITKNKILEIAEKLFSEKGYDAASMDTISKFAGVNKATIYYHFKDKNDILVSLFRKIIAELTHKTAIDINPDRPLKDKIRNEIDFLKGKRNILSIMVMEQMKDNRSNHFFKISKVVIEEELRTRAINMDSRTLQRSFIHEFFTGLIPVIMYVIFEEKWAEFNGFSKNTLPDDFIEIYENTHLKTHI